MISAAPVLDLIEAFRRSKTMFTAVKLGIFDRLHNTPQTAQSLAATLRLNENAARRLLDACVALGLLHWSEGTYRNTAVSDKYLVAQSPDTLAGYILYSDASLYPLWGELDSAVREGSNRWQKVFGNRTALFDHYFRDEAATRAFLGGMHGFGQLSSPAIVNAFDLSGYRHLVDLGGATGHLAIAACKQYPSLHATVADLPKVERFAREVIENSSVSDRITFTACDFFADELVRGDLYFLGRILHDWSDEKIHSLLAKIHASLPSHGALLIGETLVDDRRTGPVRSLMGDLNMLVCTDGRERTRAEYETLLHSAGFSSIAFRETGSVLDAILALK